MHGYLMDALPEIPGMKRPAEDATNYLEEATYRLFMIAWLLGMVHIAEAAGAEMADFSPEPLPMEEAVDQLRSRVQIPASEFYQMDAAVRFRAFTVAKMAGMDAITRVKEKIEKVLEEGETLEGFISEGRGDELLERAGFSKQSPWYWETVYRTNTISAWNAGRWSQMRRIEDTIQYVEFVAIVDSRTTEVCRHYAGVVRPMNDPIWQQITPPNHFNCRSTTRPIMSGSSEAQQTTPWSESDVRDLPAPQEGFDASPLSPKGFAQMPDSLWRRAKEYGIEDDIYKAAEKAGVSLEGAAGQSAPAASVPLNVKNRQDMTDVVKERFGPITRNGIQDVEFRRFNAFMGTNSSGRISISEKAMRLPDGKTFTPSKELLGAFKNLGRKDLTFNQEYALEALWHEVNHNRQVWTYRVANKEDIRNVIMETVNQWTSRRTYPEMLDRLGGFEPKWQKEVIESGYGYAPWVNRMDRLVARLGLKDSDILEDVRKLHLGTERMEYLDPLSDLLAQKSGVGAGKIRAALKAIKREDRFKRELRFVY